MELIAKEYGISLTTAKQFLKYGLDRAKYGRTGASINKVQLEQLAKLGYVIRGGCGTVEEVTDSGMVLWNELSKC
jgi:hypothetical protein